MGLFDTVARWFGAQGPLVVKEPGPPALSARATAYLDALPEGQVANIALGPPEPFQAIHVQIGPALGPVGAWHPRVAIRPEDHAQMAGLTLDHDGAWRVVGDVRVDAGETPNPNGRLYSLDRPVARGRPAYFPEDSAHAPPLVKQLLRSPGIKAVLLRENTIAIERVPGTGWPPIDRAVDQIARAWVVGCGQPFDSAAWQRGREDDLEAAVDRVLHEHVLPAVHKDGGDISLVEVKDGVVRVDLHGACRTCPAAAATLRLGVERTLKMAFPGRIDRVEAI